MTGRPIAAPPATSKPRARREGGRVGPSIPGPSGRDDRDTIRNGTGLAPARAPGRHRRRARRAVPLTIAIAVVATPAAAATFGELAAWCAPADTGGRPLLCAAYLDAGLGLLASPDRAAAGDARACVPAGEDPARIVGLLEDYASRNPASRRLSSAAGLGLALGGRYTCG